MINIQAFINEKEEGILSQTEDLHRALTHFKYEGKQLRTQNVKAIQILAYGLELVVEKHRRLQEKVVFPFMQAHFPRHEAAICLMETEHADITRCTGKLKEEVLKFSKSSNSLGEGKIYETGICLVTLLRHHIGFEKRNIGRSMEEELREDEKETVRKRIEDWLEKDDSR